MQSREKNFVFFKPKTLSLFSSLANVWAWLNLIMAILYLLFEIFTLDSQIAQGGSIFLPMDGHWWEWRNLTSDLVLRWIFPAVTYIVSMVGNFLMFKGISIGLNVLLELGFTMIPDEEETENE